MSRALSTPFRTQDTVTKSCMHQVRAGGGGGVTWQALFSSLGWQDFHSSGLIIPGFSDFCYFSEISQKGIIVGGKS
jgi:hypothetical protein